MECVRGSNASAAPGIRAVLSGLAAISRRQEGLCSSWIQGYRGLHTAGRALPMSGREEPDREPGPEPGPPEGPEPGPDEDVHDETRAGDRERESPRHIGPFRILSLIGEGAMGMVYEAEQDRPQRRVALKIVRPGRVPRDVLRRFELEYEFLGRLQHPGIAQIYQAGVARRGTGRNPVSRWNCCVGAGSTTRYASKSSVSKTAFPRR